MRKALVPLLASLALCGAATVALIATNARADQSGRKPMMIALVSPGSPHNMAAPPSEGGQPMPSAMPGAMPDMAARRAQMCHEMYAGRVGELAFLEAKLSLDAKQAPLFEHWKQTSLDIAKQHESDCAGGPPRRAAGQHERGMRPSMVDRLAREEEMLKKRLADIQAERPSLTALYNALTPAQKEEFGRGGMGPHMMLGMMDHPHPGMGMGMGMGMMRHGPMGASPPAPMDTPPPPAK
jgi:uncharacterized membrane protein